MKKLNKGFIDLYRDLKHKISQLNKQQTAYLESLCKTKDLESANNVLKISRRIDNQIAILDSKLNRMILHAEEYTGGIFEDLYEKYIEQKK